MAPEALRQAIGNLVENALHHAGPGGEVVIACETNGKAMEILVMDRGSGIAPQDRDRLRRRFERGAGVQNSGSGLGLSIVEAAVESCGARLDLRERPSGGLIAAIRFDRSI